MRPARVALILFFGVVVAATACGMQAELDDGGPADRADSVGVDAELAAYDADDGSRGDRGGDDDSKDNGPRDKTTGHTHAFDVGNLPCIACHEDTGIIVSKAAQLAESRHGSGDAYVRGASAGCAGCHGSEGPMARIRAGVAPHDPSVTGVANPSPINCRTCHEIHLTYEEADWALEGGTAPVVLEMTGGTYDGGPGNLCANCHQIRNEVPVATDGVIEFTSTRFGTHHGVEANMLLGEGGLLTAGSESYHYSFVAGTCQSCHMGESRAHTFEPDLAACQNCHAGLDTFDRNGLQTEISKLLDEVKAQLVASGIMNDENRSIPGAWPEEVASAMWNYMFVLEDGSHGVHNPPFAKALLESAKAALGG